MIKPFALGVIMGTIIGLLFGMPFMAGKDDGNGR